MPLPFWRLYAWLAPASINAGAAYAISEVNGSLTVTPCGSGEENSFCNTFEPGSINLTSIYFDDFRQSMPATKHFIGGPYIRFEPHFICTCQPAKQMSHEVGTDEA